jgi:hypothetical protein
LRSGIRQLITRCSTPLLLVPANSPIRIKKVLLAYDGSAKANEALFLSTYLSLKWKLDLQVIQVQDDNRKRANAQPIEKARQYLFRYQIPVEIKHLSGKPGEIIITESHNNAVDLIVMGGYGFSPLFELILGSTVDQVLVKSKIPVLICR